MNTTVNKPINGDKKRDSSGWWILVLFVVVLAVVKEGFGGGGNSPSLPLRPSYHVQSSYPVNTMATEPAASKPSSRTKRYEGLSDLERQNIRRSVSPYQTGFERRHEMDSTGPNPYGGPPRY